MFKRIVASMPTKNSTESFGEMMYFNKQKYYY